MYRGLVELGEEVKNLVKRKEWQLIADSPTAKYYTNWGLFDKYAKLEPREIDYQKPVGEWSTILGPCGYKGAHPSTIGVLAKPTESKLLAVHYYYLVDEPLFYEVDGGVSDIAVCIPSSSTWVSQHIVIRAKPSSESKLLVYLPRRAPGSTIVELLVDDNAYLDISMILEPDDNYPNAFIIRKSIGRDAKVSSGLLVVGSSTARVEDDALLVGRGSEYRYSGLAIGRREGWIDFIANIVQVAPLTKGVARVGGIALDSSKVVTRGLAKVSEEGIKSYSLFEAEVLILGDRAAGYTAPMMEIDTGDVEFATHHAAQYKEPEEIMFYLASRGLSPSEGLSLIIRGKVETVLDKARDRKLVEKAWSIVESYSLLA